MTRLMISIFGAFALFLSGSSLLWAKAHVPLNFVQICNDNGNVRNINGRRLGRAVKNGACRLPACDFDNVFLAGDSCDNTDGNADGFCDTPGSPPGIPADSAIDVTSACSDPF